MVCTESVALGECAEKACQRNACTGVSAESRGVGAHYDLSFAGATREVGAGVMVGVNLLQAIERHVRVDLSGGNVSVSEHGLHGAQVGSVGDHVRGRRMAQHMGRGVAASGLRGAVHDHPDALAGEFVSASREERVQGRACFQTAGDGHRADRSASACCAGAPRGTMRSLSPLPRTSM